MSPSRSLQVAPRPASNCERRLASFSRSMMRWRISAAALRVNVIARMWSGSTPARSRLTYRSTRTRVLAGAGRGLEDDVLRWINRVGARGGVNEVRPFLDAARDGPRSVDGPTGVLHFRLIVER